MCLHWKHAVHACTKRIPDSFGRIFWVCGLSCVAVSVAQIAAGMSPKIVGSEWQALQTRDNAVVCGQQPTKAGSPTGQKQGKLWKFMVKLELEASSYIYEKKNFGAIQVQVHMAGAICPTNQKNSA